MESPLELFRQTLGATGDRIAAIRTIRERFGLDLRQAKEVALQAEGTAASLDEHESRLADTLEQALARRRPCPNDAMLIPQVAEVPGAAGPVRFFWCWSCRELSAFADGPARLVARFGEDGRGGWRLFEAVGAAAEVQAAEVAVSQVTPDTLGLSGRVKHCT